MPTGEKYLKQVESTLKLIHTSLSKLYDFILVEMFVPSSLYLFICKHFKTLINKHRTCYFEVHLLLLLDDV